MKNLSNKEVINSEILEILSKEFLYKKSLVEDSFPKGPLGVENRP